MSIHARERASERYNVELTKIDEASIIELIKQGKSKFLYNLEKDENAKFCYVVYKNIPFKVLYKRGHNSGVKQIITIYPFNADEYNELIDNEKNEKIKQFETRIEKAIAFLKVNGYIVYKKRGKN